MEPAFTIIKLMGGNKAVAEMLGIHPTSVARWKQPLPWGTGGHIPMKRAVVLMAEAEKRGVALRPDLFLTAPVERAA